MGALPREEKQAWKDQYDGGGRSMRAVKDGLAVPLIVKWRESIGRPSLGLMARHGKSIAKQSEGRAGKKCLPVGG